MPGTATKGEIARDRGGELALNVGLRAMSEMTDASVCGVPYLALGARLGGPMTAGVKELAVDPERVELAGLVTRGDVTALAAAVLAAVLAIVNEEYPAVTEDCSFEVLIGGLGKGLCITGDVDTCAMSILGAKGDDGAEESVADSGMGDIGS